MSSEKPTKVINSAFVGRFIELLGSDEPKIIQRKLEIDYQSAKNYLSGRKPKADVLEKIVEKTNVSLNWLLLGQGKKFILTKEEIKEFDLEDAAQRYETIEDTLEAWYRFEGKELPEGLELNFHFWKDLTLEDKIQTVRDIKKFADAMNDKIDKGEIDYD